MGFRKVRGKKIPVWLTKEEIKMMHEAADNLRDQVLLHFGYYTGFRASEISNCQLRDISFEENLIKVRQGKGCKDRIIALHPKLKKVLKEWLKNIKDSKAYIFPGMGERPLGPRQIHRIITCIAYGAGIEKPVHPHTLRHSIAQHLRRDGHDLITISRFLGHEDVSTTQIYADADVTDQQRMMDKFGVDD